MIDLGPRGASFNGPKTTLAWLFGKFQRCQREHIFFGVSALKPLAPSPPSPVPILNLPDGHLRTTGHELHYITCFELLRRKGYSSNIASHLPFRCRFILPTLYAAAKGKFRP